uniref:MAM domain-containing protein n=1 Tax=Haemonchus contortus TaxID=6289 RepID=A0A7I4YID2_HAECO
MLNLNVVASLLAVVTVVNACHPQFEKELRYLDLYLGVQPDNDGEIPSKDASQFASYIPQSDALNCDLESECLWRNAPSDGLLDTSDFWYFKKTDSKLLPVQVQPGRADIAQGSHLLLAGNTSTTADSAVLISAPIACQRKPGNLTFHYWLYNSGRVEVIVARATYRRKHLQTIFRPKINCHILRPGNDICVVNIPAVNEPFRLAIRAFNLKDNVVGSMVILKNITYDAIVCSESPFPLIFGSKPLLPKSSKPIEKLSDLDCDHPQKRCRWSNAESTASEWRIGRNVERWHELMEVSAQDKSHPTSSFLFLAVDAVSPRLYAKLRSDLIPCTQATTTLSMKFWLKAGTQVEICAVDVDGLVLSCAYLSEGDSPGPIEIDVDPYSRPYRFTLEMVAFDEASIGLVAISDIRVKGLLCTEEPPPIVTTIDPPTIVSLFGLQHGPGPNVPYSLDLNCDFSTDYCSQWVNDDGLVAYGVVPSNSFKFPVPDEIQGNVATFLLEGAKASVLRSREVPCAYGAIVSVTYMKSEHSMVRLCALGHCVDGNSPSGTMTINATSAEPFEFSIEAASRKNAIVVIKKIDVYGDVCTLKTAQELVCDKLRCTFNENLCKYDSPLQKQGDVPLIIGPTGATATLGVGSHRAILRSVRFDLPSPVMLNITITQATYGSRVLLCPDITSEFESCHELLGPRVEETMKRTVMFALDAAAHRFAVVLYHDKAEQFGPADFIIHSIDITTTDDQKLC